MINKFFCIRVRAHTEMGQQIKVVGNIPELGNWDPENALILQTNENIYPTWMNHNYVTMRCDSKTVEIEFKVILCFDGGYQWELLPNRRVTLTHLKQIIFCSFNHQSESVVPIRSHSSDSLALDPQELISARKLKTKILNPLESDFDTSSDQESDFQSLLRSRSRGGSSRFEMDRNANFEEPFNPQPLLRKLNEKRLKKNFSSQDSLSDLNDSRDFGREFIFTAQKMSPRRSSAYQEDVVVEFETLKISRILNQPKAVYKTSL